MVFSDTSLLIKGCFVHYYQFNIKTYAASTAHLTDGEDLAYRRLIDFYYDTELPIPTALPPLTRRLRLALPDVESVLKEFFLETSDGWKHAYIDGDIAKYKVFITRQKANGSKGGRAPKPDANPPITHRLPTAKPTNNKQPITINKENIGEKATRGARLPATFLPNFDFAKTEGIQNPAAEFEKFKDYWNSQAGAKAVKTDWQATWRNWCRNSRKDVKNTVYETPVTTPSRQLVGAKMQQAIQESMVTLKPIAEIYARLNQ